jgi:hypothetical protein
MNEDRKEFSMADGIIVLIWLPLSFALMYALAFLLADGSGFADRIVFTYFMFISWLQMITLTSVDVFHLGLGLGLLFIGSACVSAFKRYELARVNIERKSLAIDIAEDKRQMKIEVALEAIDLFNDTKIAIDMVRSDIIIKEEIEELDAIDTDSDFGKKVNKNKEAAIVLLRLEECVEIFAALNTLRPTFFALFDTKAAFDKVTSAIEEIKAAANEALDGKNAQKNAKVLFKSADGDSISKKVDDAIKQIEKMAVPVIKG